MDANDSPGSELTRDHAVLGSRVRYEDRNTVNLLERWRIKREVFREISFSLHSSIAIAN
jgi:hypothetical protein